MNQEKWMNAFREECHHAERTKAGCRMCTADLLNSAYQKGIKDGRAQQQESISFSVNDEEKHLRRLMDHGALDTALLTAAMQRLREHRADD